MPLEIRRAGDPVLRQKARPLAPDEILGREVQQLVADMRDTLRATPGSGLAAPQVGESVQLIAIEARPEATTSAPPRRLDVIGWQPLDFQILINPVVSVVDETPLCFFEGCLCLPEYMAAVPRATAVRVDALNEKAESVTLRLSAWPARIVQHEVDHLRGILYCDRMLARSFTTIEQYRAHWSDKTSAEIASAFGFEGR
jgi:peptide deformylase